MKNSRIRIQLPKLETLDASGLIPHVNHQEQQTNGFLFDSELGGKYRTIILFFFSYFIVFT